MDELTLELFEPGMSALHRAGLGGLAATLAVLDKDKQADKSFGSWTIEPDRVVLRWEGEDGARRFLRGLFDYGFQVRDGLIHLPGQYGDVTPDIGTRTELHTALINTFLQHGKTRKLGKETQRSFEIDERRFSVKYKPCSGFKHQKLWEKLVDAKGRLATKPLEVAGALHPGAMVRHNAFSAATKITEPPRRALALMFALVGCLSLRLRGRGGGVLLVPEVEDLVVFARQRSGINPRSARDGRVASPADAALQAQLRLRGERAARSLRVPACQAVLFSVLPWATQQKTRAAALWVRPSDQALREFRQAMANLPARRLTRSEKDGGESYWIESAIRPLIAENLVRGRRWYRGFRDLLASGEGARNVSFERGGLHTMTEHLEPGGEEVIVRAVHEAMRRRYGVIAGENEGKETARRNRMSREYERRRLSFVGAKRAPDFRRALADLLSHSGSLASLQSGWRELLPWLRDDRWEYARDLALIALASYAGAERATPEIEGEDQ